MLQRTLVVAVLLSTTPAFAAEVRGTYLEARTCDVYTGACFANADTGLTGRHAVMAWKIESGTVAGQKLDGLGVVAVVAARETLGLKQTLGGQVVVLVDEKATSAQREALTFFVREQAGILAERVVAVRTAPIQLTICPCAGDSCARLSAGEARVETRCLDAVHDIACGSESAYYAPLAKGVTAVPAMATEHSFKGAGFGETWSDGERRGAYVGTFVLR